WQHDSIETDATQQHYAKQRPPFDEHRIFMLPPYFVIQMIRDRELEKMSRNSFVSEDRPRVFNRRANIKILRLQIVSWDEKESGRIFVVNARRIHETAGTGRLERVWQLSNLKRAEVIR